MNVHITPRSQEKREKSWTNRYTNNKRPQFPSPVKSETMFDKIYDYKPPKGKKFMIKEKKKPKMPSFRPVHSPMSDQETSRRPSWNKWTSSGTHRNKVKCWQTRTFFDDLPKISVTKHTPRHLSRDNKTLKSLILEARMNKNRPETAHSCPAISYKVVLSSSFSPNTNAMM